MYDFMILGGGPAGLAAAVYAIRKRLNVILVGDNLGGKTGWHLDVPWLEQHHVITGEEIVRKMKGEIRYLDFARVLDRAIRVDTIAGGFRVHIASGDQFDARALLVATGAHPQTLRIPGEEKYRFKGVTYSAISYASAMVDKTVAVIGDGPLALRSTAELLRSAARVYLIAPTAGILETPLGRRLQDAPHFSMYEGYFVSEIQGRDYAEAIVVRNGDGIARSLKVDCVFVEVDLIPDSELVCHLVRCDDQGHILVDHRNRTSREGVFAAGDVTNVYAEQVLIAVGEGTKAALSVSEYLLSSEFEPEPAS